MNKEAPSYSCVVSEARYKERTPPIIEDLYDIIIRIKYLRVCVNLSAIR